ncbi:MAG: aspartate--tRNA ligase [Candidatus Marinimicrobia bacterium]|jgi:aspartyl-tRNA synthetase|nr:aspartate--tRNA ligase [Candidatus Neomarinimicrobiota bacterium]MDP6457374.1 aspartate--tRNA ligase [Candidatus Neomarinimicrobiota bacterium]MDP6593504.1 aspartate--tRNA ligase [Candidatus Neomarinimicrobiota bacterium]MDP6836314.1 aspartate--tRNA ligase [Candidatus Neomarinimicrobiota bacterium]MDP6966756.1 aspartate--tRNA ligase [Candidatus Neomarinimicrobiota bacterium]|tara:strand:- start:198 stop:1979 length:1782 start_codon:yes stop_codon:yes gene_type:complete
MFERTHTCGELKSSDVGAAVVLNGWVSTTRDHGGVIFVDIRDRYGTTQVTFNEETHPDSFAVARKLSMEDVISVKGTVRARVKGAVNRDLTTGEIEVESEHIELLNEAAPLPFLVSDRDSATEEVRLKYRYLELRTDELQRTMQIRHEASQVVRNHLSGNGFMEIETPFLMKSTPEGARDFLVPSRLHSGKFYALPQSPQQYKQILMIAGFDRYFQIVKCFRDEDFRADRQPEFTQIDIEMSFVDEEDIRQVVEGLVTVVFKEIIDVQLDAPFPVLSYRDAVETYGSDRPDLRFDLPLVDFSELACQSDFNALKSAPCVKAIVIPDADSYSRKVIDGFSQFVMDYSSQEKKTPLAGVTWMRCKEGDLTGGIAKFFAEALRQDVIKSLSLEEGDLVLSVGGERETVLSTMGALRLEIARRHDLMDAGVFRPVWVREYPLFERDDNGGWTFLHHPFTSPRPDDLDKLDSDPGAACSRAYDLVINGWEIAGGSIRNHDPQVQMKIFELLGIPEKEAKERFGFLLEALSYGAPPHGGIAFGYDRLVMILAGATQIRDVIAFPKTTSALNLMDGSPSEVPQEQLKELGIKIRKKKADL